MLWMVSSIKLLSEIGVLALLGRGLLRLWLAWLHPLHIERNLFLRLLEALSAPWLWLAQALSPRRVGCTHGPWLAFALATTLWLAATASKMWLCLQNGGAVCQ